MKGLFIKESFAYPENLLTWTISIVRDPWQVKQDVVRAPCRLMHSFFLWAVLQAHCEGLAASLCLVGQRGPL